MINSNNRDVETNIFYIPADYPFETLFITKKYKTQKISSEKTLFKFPVSTNSLRLQNLKKHWMKWMN